jgi:deoxyribodipyrimidine photo-lyase
MQQAVNIMWFRRDLRLSDNAALYYALKDELPVIPIFIFDTNILDDLEDKRDRRVEFIRDALLDMQDVLKDHNTSLQVFYNTPQQAFNQLVKQYAIQKVFANEDYEQYAIDRDASISALLKKAQCCIKPL